MSEYQLYEFLALESAAQRRGSGVCAHAVEPRPADTDAGDVHLLLQQFPGDPLKLLAKHYDVMLYLANWGSKQLAFRFSKDSDRLAGAPAVRLWRRGDRADYGRPVCHPKHRLPRK